MLRWEQFWKLDYKIEKFFTLHWIPHSICLKVVALHLEEETTTWYQCMERNGSLTSWKVFLNELHNQFGASIYGNLRGRIAKLTQTRRITQYHTNFKKLMM